MSRATKRIRINLPTPMLPSQPSFPSTSAAMDVDLPPSAAAADVASPISNLPDHLLHHIISFLPPEYPAAMDVDLPPSPTAATDPISDVDSPISDLPEHLIHHIISFLPPEHPPARLCVVSKRFLSAWHSFPFLSFDDSSGGRNRSALFIPHIKSTVDRRRRLGVNHLQKLRIKIAAAFKFDRSSTDGIKTAVDFAIESGVRALELDFGFSHCDLPPRILSATSLTSLRLSGFNFDPTCLAGFNLDPTGLGIGTDLTLSYPLLEDLKLCSSRGIQALRIACPLLKSLEIDSCEGLISVGLDSHTSKLESIRLKGFSGLIEPVIVSSLRLLDLEFHGSSIPLRILSLKSVTALRLVGFDLSEAATRFGGRVVTISYPLLEDLKLQRCTGIEVLYVSCPGLESLEILDCADLRSLRLDPQTSKLKSIQLWGFVPRDGDDNFKLSHDNLKAADLDLASRSTVGITMRCPRLESLSIKYKKERFSGEIDLSGCESLQSLKLTRAGVTDQWVKRNVVSMAENLKHLELNECLELESLSVHNLGLKSLALTGCGNLQMIEVDSVELHNFWIEFRSLKVQDIALGSSGKLFAGVSLLPDSGTVDNAYYEWLTWILKSFGKSRELTIMASALKKLTIPKSLRERKMSPMYDLGSLQVDIIEGSKEKSTSAELVELVDSLLWLAPRPNLLSLLVREKRKTLKFKYEVQPKGEEELGSDFGCCEPWWPFKCWRHSLREVTMENFEPEEKMGLEPFFKTNAKSTCLEFVDH